MRQDELRLSFGDFLSAGDQGVEQTGSRNIADQSASNRSLADKEKLAPDAFLRSFNSTWL